MRGLYHAFSVLPKDTAEWGRFFRSVRFGLSDGRDAETVIDSKAPKDAQYLVGATNDTLTAERVVTDTDTIAWDLATAGQAKAELHYARTAAEIAAGVTPTNYAYAPGDIRRYGTNTTPGTSDMTTVIANCLAVSATHRAIFQPETYLSGTQLIENTGGGQTHTHDASAASVAAHTHTLGAMQSPYFTTWILKRRS